MSNFPYDVLRDLDVQVATKLMGYHPVPIGPDARGEHAGAALVPPDWHGVPQEFLPNLGEVPYTAYVPKFSSSWRAAVRLVQWIRNQRRLYLEIDFDTDSTACRFYRDGQTRGNFVASQNAFEAITRAALQSVPPYTP